MVACNPMEGDCHTDSNPAPLMGGNGNKDKCESTDPECELGRGRGEGGIGSICYPGELACLIANNGYDQYDLNDFCPLSYTLTECHDKELPLYMGSAPLYIDPLEWDALQKALRDEVHGKSIWWIIANASGYDTPFYDRSVYGFGRLSGTGCLNSTCYDRSELNYIAQGELWAAAGVPKPIAHIIVWTWKLSPVMHWPTVPSGGTIEMTDVGYDDYHANHP